MNEPMDPCRQRRKPWTSLAQTGEQQQCELPCIALLIRTEAGQILQTGALDWLVSYNKRPRCDQKEKRKQLKLQKLKVYTGDDDDDDGDDWDDHDDDVCVMYIEHQNDILQYHV